MAGLFFRQLGALFWKNWIVLGKHPFVSLRLLSRSHGPTRRPVRNKTVEHHPMFHSPRWVRNFPFDCARVLRQEEQREGFSLSLWFVGTHFVAPSSVSQIQWPFATFGMISMAL